MSPCAVSALPSRLSPCSTAGVHNTERWSRWCWSSGGLRLLETDLSLRRTLQWLHRIEVNLVSLPVCAPSSESGSTDLMPIVPSLLVLALTLTLTPIRGSCWAHRV
ncbi:uncharacterized protein K489DRAFT_375591 [Dissoconium aciculare CBS 342.82]|uniref:Uncharacterized protein n=1 Tax=Dissoconium aciculare CBS 342.82 TaxID=1314786 RepID=A0A6J3MIF9_9PEZI|nr:uncharacterized protein K489DRAFT_375591 [Dissoconium aciculare CBS 342.82]KAF1827489.1 hypothetical protein K489DRAFT_375591 [Dissoconium aciculare CBS 342.82]